MTSPQIDLAQTLTKVTALLLETTNPDGLLGDLADLSVATLPGATACGVTLSGPDHRPRTVAFSNELAHHVDDIQYELGDGPCLEAMRTDTVIHSGDLREESRWAPFPEQAARRGVLSVMSLPMELPARTLGVFNLYSNDVAAFDADQEAIGRVFSEHAGLVVGAAERYLATLETTAHLQDALSSRAVIDQAKGIIMGQRRCTADEAFQQLVAVSQDHNIKLRDVATALVQSMTRP
jgi:GAF domain-containing protein